MKVLRLTSKDYNHLKPYDIGDKVLHTESEFFYVPHSSKEIIKYYISDDEDYLSRKILTFSNLTIFNNEYPIEELIMPNGIVLLHDDFKGIILPKKSGINASVYLRNKNVPIKTKIDILKQIGLIIRKVASADPSTNAALADVHGDNFIVENKTKKVYALDTDGMSVYDSVGRTNYYLYHNPWVRNCDKYEYNYVGLIKGTTKTDIFCFIMMILQVISDYKSIFRVNLDEYLAYIGYLDHLGFDTHLIEAFVSIALDKQDNINPVDYLDDLNRISPESSIKTFRRY